MDSLSRRAPLRREADPQVDRGALIDLRHVGAILRRRWMVLCAAMILGRLEILGVLILFLPSFYR